MHNVTLIPGDGIGPEVTGATRDVVLASGAAVRFEEVLAGQRAEREAGAPLPAAVFDSIARTRLALKGPTQTPFGGDYRIHIERKDAEGRLETRSYPSIAIALRKELGLYVNVRPVRNYPGVPSRYDRVDLLIFRENSEDLYVGMERMIDEGTAEAIKIISLRATERVARFAFDYMRRLGRHKLTIGHKANVMKMTDGLFLKTAQDLAKEYPEIEVNQRVVDALCMELVMKPEEFDALLLPNLYGDIVSDLAAGLVGGLGLAPGANIGADCAMFEAVHGTAPDIAGKDRANPMATILSAVMLLRYVGEAAAGDRIEKALAEVLREKRFVTPDLGGDAGTRRMTEAIVEKLQ
ncbi:MAG: isocitrate/isopropylmalate dehydrogenase family protein [Betaproteobacteria bacterium]|nr:isocitrate/isopropylmalate dehydrogenase family protein [Betaproteobacteria bacterium]